MDTVNNQNQNRPNPTRRNGENKKVVAVNNRKNKSASTIMIINLEDTGNNY